MSYIFKEKSTYQLELGANVVGNHTFFKVWAPFRDHLKLEIVGKQTIEMIKDEKGYFSAKVDQNLNHARYFYAYEGKKLPDPISRSLPEGLDGPSEVIDPTEFGWSDQDWKGISIEEAIFYEVHIGTFSPEGTFAKALQRIPHLKKLGVTCLEILPIAAFPGAYNWGYDGVSFFCPYQGYGGHWEFKTLINECHRNGIAVCLDVVYNHLAPEGNYLGDFGPYASAITSSEWGSRLNIDGPYSDQVRTMLLNNVCYWFSEYHIDMLRLDSIGTIIDTSASPFLPLLREEVYSLEKNLGRKIYLIGESHRNDSLVVRSMKEGGFELDAIWNDDFHYSLFVTLTGETKIWYVDFSGIEDLAIALSKGFVFGNKYSTFFQMHRGNSSEGIPLHKFIVFLANHDRIGNRPDGDRLQKLMGASLARVAAITTILNPSTPLLFMGQEYGEEAPFKFFIDFKDPKLMSLIFEHRTKAGYNYLPDKKAFEESKLKWDLEKEEHRKMFEFYCSLIQLRKVYLPRQDITLGNGLFVYCDANRKILSWEYQSKKGKWVGVFCHFGNATISNEKLPFKKVERFEQIYCSDPSFKKIESKVIPHLEGPGAFVCI